jgi:hypothetical protein
MRNEAVNLPLVEIDERFHNLIPSRFPPVPVYERIAGGRDELFAQVEEITNPRVRERDRLTQGLAPIDQQLPRFKNWNHAPFVYPNPEGSRFFKANRNVLELAGDLQTALVISVGKRETFLRRTAEPPTLIEMRQIVRPVRGRYLDARGWKGGNDRDRRLALGDDAVRLDLDGILFSPSERPSALGIVVLKSECLGKPDQVDHFKYVWNGQRISVLYSFRNDQKYSPDDLALDEAIMAA